MNIYIFIYYRPLLNSMPSSKNGNWRLYAVHTKKGIFSDDRKKHLRMVNTGSDPGYENIEPEHVGPLVRNMYTDGNQLVDKPPAVNSLWQECGVQLYNHPTHGRVYLVYNLSHQTSVPLPPQPPQPPQPRTDERLPHPFQ